MTARRRAYDAAADNATVPYKPASHTNLQGGPDAPCLAF